MGEDGAYASLRVRSLGISACNFTALCPLSNRNSFELSPMDFSLAWKHFMTAQLGLNEKLDIRQKIAQLSHRQILGL